MKSNKGKLYIVSTPIGNLDDITLRAINTLKSVDMIAAEDTRHTRELLNYLDIKKELLSFNEFADEDKVNFILGKIEEGKDIALVSDAGTPLISDPGLRLTEFAIKNDIEIIAVPGATALINALVLSGVDTRSFTFIGFLSEDNKKRKEQLKGIAERCETLIFYISVHNLQKDLKLIMDTLGADRKASLSREMTKKFEETVRGTLLSIYTHCMSREARGEYVLVVSGLDKSELRKMQIDRWNEMSIEDHMSYYMNNGVAEMDAIKKVANDRGLPKNEIYKAVKMK